MTRLFSKSSILLLFKLGITLWFIGIAWDFIQFAQSDVDVYVRDDSKPVTLEDVRCGIEDPNTILFSVMSMMSALVYNDQQPKYYKDWKFVYEGTEKSLNANESHLISGLKFVIWENEIQKKMVIVYRGTSSMIDFHANLHWLTKLTDIALDQYEQIPLVLEHIAPYIKNDYGVYAAGHSLGGGLAQHTVYQSEKIDTAFVFNSTPVTGWHDLNLEQQSNNAKGATIYRVNEKGEILEFLRLLMKVGSLVSPAPNVNPYVKEYRMNLEGGNLIEEHSIAAMADSLESTSQCTKEIVTLDSNELT